MSPWAPSLIGQPIIWALPQSLLRRLTLSVLFTITTTSYQTTCTVSERSSIKGTRQYKPTQCSSFALRHNMSTTVYSSVDLLLQNYSVTPTCLLPFCYRMVRFIYWVFSIRRRYRLRPPRITTITPAIPITQIRLERKLVMKDSDVRTIGRKPSVADPGFPRWGANPRGGGALTNFFA